MKLACNLKKMTKVEKYFIVLGFVDFIHFMVENNGHDCYKKAQEYLNTLDFENHDTEDYKNEIGQWAIKHNFTWVGERKHIYIEDSWKFWCVGMDVMDYAKGDRVFVFADGLGKGTIRGNDGRGRFDVKLDSDRGDEVEHDVTYGVHVRYLRKMPKVSGKTLAK
jgi:hypothetical protein